MPLHEFKCKNCGHKFESFSFRNGTRKLKMKCPSCGSTDTEKMVVNKFSFRLRGDGWPGKENKKNREPKNETD